MKNTKAPSEKSKSTNVTHERLADLPFRSAKALKEAQEQVHLDVWKRLEEAKTLHEMLQRSEYNFWHEEFRHGLVCSYGEKTDLNLVRVFSEGQGIRININPHMADTTGSTETVLGTLIKAMSESFADTYYRAKGILPAQNPLKETSRIDALIQRP